MDEKMDRIIQLLEGDKAFAGNVIEQIHVEVCAINKTLYRILCSVNPEEDAAWGKYQQSRGASTTAIENVLPYPLMGDPPPPVAGGNFPTAYPRLPPEMLSYEWAEPTDDAMHEFEAPSSDCVLCGLPQSARCHRRTKVERDATDKEREESNA